ncbi:MAG: glycosyl hydrolase [Reichenbachiella sp.]|uniref:WD40/YVTN/BNR-like repeat-containing protein n=1 Tax=Reichenbachiella sp. TaxID=2184521 RepID=UPI003266B3C5
MNRITALLITLLFSTSIFSQSKLEIPAPTAAEARMANKDLKKEMLNSSLVKDISFRNVGPTIMSGRVTDLAVDPADPTHFYVAYASGGLWETKNGGLTYVPLFDNQMVMSIGDIAVNWKTKTIYVGTGENNSSRSSYSGVGIFKTTNNGKTWTHLGLADTQHIGRITLHPTNDRTLWVAAIGHLYSDNAERGVYKSNNGGQTWAKTLYVDDKTGAIDLVIDPSNTNVLYASMWQRDRKAWNFEGSGTGSGIYKSTDGGQHWTEISGGNSGFPDTKGTGRIGLAIYPKNPKIIYALLDNQDRRPEDTSKKPVDGLTKDQIKGMDKATFLALDDSLLNDYLKSNGFPKKYDFKEVKRLVKVSEARPTDIASYFDDANAKLFNTPVIGAELYRSDDGGATWRKTHQDYIENMYYSYGYYFGEVRVSAVNADHVYALGVPIIKSEDGGKNWKTIEGDNQHGDHQALWVDPKGSGYLISGNDGGVNISYDDGRSWAKSNSHPVGQFYDINYDMDEPYNIYGGLQDNGVWWGPSNYEASTSWQMTGKYPWQMLMWGDGMQTEIDTRDNNTIYTGFQFGHYYRIDKTSGKEKKITPMHELGQKPFRWNWEAPILLSKHNQDVVYMGSNRLHKSINKGDDFAPPTKDLTKGGKAGNVSYGTLTEIAESPLKAGLLYIGTDDGVVQVSQDDGSTWTMIDPNLTKNYWVSSIVPSKYKEGRVYLTLNGYRWDQFDALVYVSENYGKIWRAIGLNLPKEPVNVITEDPIKEDVLYIGTDHGAYISTDRGNTFMPLGGGLPNVAVHDMAVHPRENELIIGTHGRSVYVGDISAIQTLATLERKESLKILSVEEVAFSKSWGEFKNENQWSGYNEPSNQIIFYSQSSGQGQLKVIQGDRTMFQTNLTIVAGLNFYNYDLSRSGEAAEDGTPEAKNGKVYLEMGKYDLALFNGKSTVKGQLEIVEK